MKRNLNPKFVEFIPDKIEDNIIYISIEYCTAVHQCACGCGNEVVTPISPNDWKLIFNGKSISLTPSIGNWSFECRSHYWIKENQIVWAKNWSKQRIEEGRRNDKENKSRYFSQDIAEKDDRSIKIKKRKWWRNLMSWLNIYIY